jgi:hypothetical protein
MKVHFPGLVIEWIPEHRKCISRFDDGTEAHAIPHDTPEYHRHAEEKSTGDVDLYCWQHDIAHQVVAMMAGRRVSLVLWNLAHGISTDSPACELEEREAQEFQRQFFLRP